LAVTLTVDSLLENLRADLTSRCDNDTRFSVWSNAISGLLAMGARLHGEILSIAAWGARRLSRWMLLEAACRPPGLFHITTRWLPWWWWPHLIGTLIVVSVITVRISDNDPGFPGSAR